MAESIGIKITSSEEIARSIKIVRQYTELSIGEIKERIAKNKYIVEGNYVDENDILLILNLNNQLSENGIQTELYEHERLTDIDFLKNLVNTYSAINNEIIDRIDKETNEKK